MTRLKRLLIHRFRWVSPGTELRFADGVNLILGRNGTGKTTLLELLAAVWSGDFSAYREESFDVEAEFGVGESGWIRMRVESRAPGPFGDEGLEALQALMSDPTRAREPDWKVSVEVHHGVPKIVDNFVVTANAREMTLDNQPFESNLLEINPFGSQGIVDTALWVALYRFSAGEPDWQAHQTADLVWGSNPLTTPLMRFPEDRSWLDIAASQIQVALIYNGSGQVVHARKTGDSLRVRRLRELIRERVVMLDSAPRTLRFEDEDLPVLAQTAHALELGSVELSLEMTMGGRSATDHTFGWLRYEDPTFHFTKRDGSRLPLRALSYGQKRLFAFLLYADSSPRVIIADELANGLHYSMLDEVMRLISDRQSFLAMQDPLILDHVTLESPEHIQRAIVTCGLAEVEGRERWIWSQPGPEEAADLYGAAQVGIQYTSELLKTRGLW